MNNNRVCQEHIGNNCDEEPFEPGRRKNKRSKSLNCSLTRKGKRTWKGMCQMEKHKSQLD